MFDGDLAEAVVLAMKKLRADLHVMSSALENNDGELLFCALLDVRVATEFFELVAETMFPDDHADPDVIYKRYAETIATVDPILHTQWDWRDDV